MPEGSVEGQIERLIVRMAAHRGRRIAVFCGSSNDVPAVYKEESARLGALLAHSHCALVYGGGSCGLMGSVVEGAHASGMAVIASVLPAFMQSMCGCKRQD